MVYSGIQKDGVVSQEYIDTRTPIAKRQIAKGGYRLADYLKEIKKEMDEKNPAII